MKIYFSERYLFTIMLKHKLNGILRRKYEYDVFEPDSEPVKNIIVTFMKGNIKSLTKNCNSSKNHYCIGIPGTFTLYISVGKKYYHIVHQKTETECIFYYF